MGLVAGKAAWGICVAKSLNVTLDGPLLSDPYIRFGVPLEMLDVGRQSLGNIDYTPGGIGISDASGKFKFFANITRAIITPEVTAHVMLELNAITETLEAWDVVDGTPVYFFAVLDTYSKTFTDYNVSINKFVKTKIKNMRWKIVGKKVIELSCIFDSADF